MRKQIWEIGGSGYAYIQDKHRVKERSLQINEDPTNDYEFVDLGLPSGTLWATCNVGASSPEEYGLYFAWGETEGYSDATSGKEFSWSDYKYGDGSTFEKYNSDGLTTLELTDDAARVNMGGNWCIPTEIEYQELLDNTTSAWTTVNNVNGVKFTSTKEGYTDKYIFIPTAGYCNYGSVEGTSSSVYLWSSSLDSSNVAFAHNLVFSSSGAKVSTSRRNHGYSVRPVKSKS